MEASFQLNKYHIQNPELAKAVDRNRVIASLIMDEILKVDGDMVKGLASRKVFQNTFACCISVYGFCKIAWMIEKFKDLLRENSDKISKLEIILDRLKNLDGLKRLLDEDFPEKRRVFLMVKDFEPFSVQIYEKYEKEYRISKSKLDTQLNMKYIQVGLMKALNLDSLYGGDEMDILQWIKYKMEVS
jgi:hypothetical protein